MFPKTLSDLHIILTTFRSGKEKNTARFCLGKKMERKGVGIVFFLLSQYRKHYFHLSDCSTAWGHYLICCRHSTADAKQASFVDGSTCIGRMSVRREAPSITRTWTILGRTQPAGGDPACWGGQALTWALLTQNAILHSKEKHVW